MNQGLNQSHDSLSGKSAVGRKMVFSRCPRPARQAGTVAVCLASCASLRPTSCTNPLRAEDGEFEVAKGPMWLSSLASGTPHARGEMRPRDLPQMSKQYVSILSQAGG